MVQLSLRAPSPSLLVGLTGFHQGAAFYPSGFYATPQLTKRDQWSKLVRWVGSLCFNPFWKSLHLGILMGDATVSAQREQICGGNLQWTSTPSRRINSNYRSEAGIAFMIYA